MVYVSAISQLKIARRNKYSISLLCIELDDYQDVIERYGPLVGDVVLKEAASRITSCVRDTDILGRFDSDEFLLLSPYADATSAANLAQRIKTIISDIPIHADHKNIFITTSIGITTTESDSYNLDELLDSADAALYLAKNTGRNRFQIYTK